MSNSQDNNNLKKEKVNGSYIEYKGRPLVREDNTIVYGDMSDKYVLILEIMSYKEINDMQVPEKIFIQVVNTKDTTDIFTQGQKNDLYSALDIGIIWLERALRS